MAALLRRRESLLGSVACLLLVGAVVAFGLARERSAARERIQREAGALEEAHRLGAAQQAFRKRTGRFGWLEELRDAGLLEGRRLRAGPQGLQVLVDGYAIDALLPTGPALAGQVPMGAKAAGLPEPTLVDRHVALVARPERPGIDGYRIWYVDEEGRTFLCEGVSDVAGLAENGLPPLRVTRSHSQEEPGVVWRLLEDLTRD